MFKKFKLYLILVIVLLLSSFLVAIFNLLNLLGSNASSIINMIIGIGIFGALGYRWGLKAIKRGYLAGLKIGSISIVILFLISFFILKVNISISMFIYYLILLIASIFGAMIGISKKEPDQSK